MASRIVFGYEAYAHLSNECLYIKIPLDIAEDVMDGMGPNPGASHEKQHNADTRYVLFGSIFVTRSDIVSEADQGMQEAEAASCVDDA
jgi:hypothetical protein